MLTTFCVQAQPIDNAAKEKLFPAKPLIHDAVQVGKLNLIKQLVIKDKRSVNAKNSTLWTPLHIAANMGRTGIVQFLITNGADVNAQCSLGGTPFHYANNVSISKILVTNGADFCITDKIESKGPYQIHNKEIIKFYRSLSRLNLLYKRTTPKKYFFNKYINGRPKQSTENLFILNLLFKEYKTSKSLITTFTEEDFRFIWDKDWDRDEAKPLSQGLNTLYRLAKENNSKTCVKDLLDCSIKLRVLSGLGNGNSGLCVIQLIQSYE